MRVEAEREQVALKVDVSQIHICSASSQTEAGKGVIRQKNALSAS